MSTPPVVVKFVVVGSAGVGKTSLLNRYVDKRFTSAYAISLEAEVTTELHEFSPSFALSKFTLTILACVLVAPRYKSTIGADFKMKECCISVNGQQRSVSVRPVSGSRRSLPVLVNSARRSGLCHGS